MADAGIIHHLRNYVSAGALSAIVGLVSFPILTRNLSVADYGLVGLITATATFFIAIGKLGVQHAVIRYFAQVRHGKATTTLAQLNSTIVAIFSVLAVMTTILWLFSGYFLFPAFLQTDNISSLFLVGSCIVLVRVGGSGIMNLLRAQQRSAEVAYAQVIARILNLALILGLLLATNLNPWLVIACLLMAETAGMCFAAYRYRSDFYFRAREVSGKLVKAMLFYGLPLMLLESLGLVLRLSDRYLIESMMGVSSLGQYSASYNLCSYLDIIVIAAIMQALRPAYMQIWEAQGMQATRDFMSRSFNVYIMIGIPFVTMFAVTSPYLLSLLAGVKYQPGTVIIPYVALSFWMEGTIHFLAAGLYIFKNTRPLMLCGLVATVVNVILNIQVIPHYGITGAAAVTVLSYALFISSIAVVSFRHVSFKVAFHGPVIILALSIAVFALLSMLDFGSDLFNFLIKGMLGTLVLSGAVWYTVPDIREWVLLRKNSLLKSRSA